MFVMKKLDRVLQIILIYTCLVFLLSACISSSCSMQAVAGGAQYCEETPTGE
ncbi:MAG: hypothetical protein HYU84_09720 [Chloroflexi bacterium]|nr:hypothetical protein [Chloroflexota bacterium]